MVRKLCPAPGSRNLHLPLEGHQLLGEEWGGAITHRGLPQFSEVLSFSSVFAPFLRYSSEEGREGGGVGVSAVLGPHTMGGTFTFWAS